MSTHRRLSTPLANAARADAVFGLRLVELKKFMEGNDIPKAMMSDADLEWLGALVMSWAETNLMVIKTGDAGNGIRISLKAMLELMKEFVYSNSEHLEAVGCPKSVLEMIRNMAMKAHVRFLLVSTGG